MSWLGFDLINDAIAKAKTELEKSVDNALGIEKEQGAESQRSSLPTAPGSRPVAAEASTLDQAHVQPSQEGHGAGSHQPANGKAEVAVPNGSTAEGQVVPATPAVAPKVVKKVIKKVIKKVPKAQPADGLAKAPSTDPASSLPSVSSAAELTPLGDAAVAVGTPAAELDAQLSPAVASALSNISLQAHDSLQAPVLLTSTQLQTQPGSALLQPHDSAQAAAANSSSLQGHSMPTPASQPGDTATHEPLLTSTSAQNGHHSPDSQGEQAPPSSQHQPLASSGHSPSALPIQQAAAADAAILDTPDPDNSKRKGQKSPSQTALAQHAPKHVTLPPQPASGSQVSRKQSLDEAALTPAPQPVVNSANHSRKQSLDGVRPVPQSAAAVSGPQGAAGGLTEPQLTAVNVRAPGDLQQLSHEELVAMVAELQEQVAARDERLGRQAGAMCELQQVMAQLQDRNEALALKTASISEQDWEEMRKEFEQRLATAERKVYALNKERDALKRGNEKLSDYGALIKEKDGIIKQVMDEGERLSARQAELESTQKKLRGQIKDLEMERDKLSHKLASEEAGAEALRRAKAKLERDLQAAQEQAAQELEQARLQADSLLLKARADQAEAEERAREAANAGLHRKLRESESRSEALSETVMELREALDRQRQAADLREEMLKQDLADLERRCQGAELRHQELAAKLPDATRPLLRQIEAMQAAADAQAGAWAAAEQSLASRIDDAEGRAAAAAERERHASERAQTLQARAAGLEAALGAARMELKSLMEQVDLAGHASSSLQQQLNDARQAAQLEAEHAKLARQQLQQIEDKHATALLVEHQARQAAEGDAATVRKEYERRLAELEAQLNEAREGGGGGGGGMFGGESSTSRGGAADPPAMAAPGYRWVLQKEGESPKHSQARPHERHDAHNSHSIPFANPALQEPSSDGGAVPIESSAAELWSSLMPANSMMVGNMPLASELESMRATLRIRGGEVASLEAQVRALEATRDRLSEELVAAAQKSEEAATAIMTVDALHKEVAELKTRYVACVELLGERDEALEELRDDLMDVKNLYREQIEFMVHQLTGRRPGDGPPPQPPAAEPA